MRSSQRGRLGQQAMQAMGAAGLGIKELETTKRLKATSEPRTPFAPRMASCLVATSSEIWVAGLWIRRTEGLHGSVNSTDLNQEANLVFVGFGVGRGGWYYFKVCLTLGQMVQGQEIRSGFLYHFRTQRSKRSTLYQPLVSSLFWYLGGGGSAGANSHH